MYAPAIDELVPGNDFAPDFPCFTSELVIDEFDSWTLSDAYAPPCGPCWEDFAESGRR